ncbi:MAG: hypothetical protein ACYC3X_16500 [Pirellulaceae bacterium]
MPRAADALGLCTNWASTSAKLRTRYSLASESCRSQAMIAADTAPSHGRVEQMAYAADVVVPRARSDTPDQSPLAKVQRVLRVNPCTDGTGRYGANSCNACSKRMATYSLLDRFPLTVPGHIAFLEFVRDETQFAAQAKRQQLAQVLDTGSKH